MNKTVKIVLITVLVMIAIFGVLVIGALFRPGIIRDIQMKPACKVADAFMSDMQNGNLGGAYTLVSDDIRQNAGNAGALPAYLGIFKPIVSFDRGPSMIDDDRSKVSAAYWVVFSDQTTATIFLNLIKNEEEWEITSLSVVEK